MELKTSSRMISVCCLFQFMRSMESSTLNRVGRTLVMTKVCVCVCVRVYIYVHMCESVRVGCCIVPSFSSAHTYTYR